MLGVKGSEVAGVEEYGRKFFFIAESPWQIVDKLVTDFTDFAGLKLHEETRDLATDFH